LEAQFLQEARNKGALTQNGLEMFVYQGALAFEKWTGIFPDVERMRNNVLQQLGGRIC
jgi:shikimate dehydrogenase